MRRRSLPILSTLLTLVVLAGVAGAIWLGRLPPSFNPFRLTSLADPDVWFLDARLAELRTDRALCATLLVRPHIVARQIPDQPPENGCGWINAVRVDQVGGARLSADRTTCPLAAGLALWVAHDVQPLALAHFGQRVAAVQQMGVYACRNIIGSKYWSGMRSEHAEGNAIDISGFVLADGRTVSVLRHWGREGKEAGFLREVHARACRYFRVALGPEFNAAHKDHFHYDRGGLKFCR